MGREDESISPESLSTLAVNEEVTCFGLPFERDLGGIDRGGVLVGVVSLLLKAVVTL